MGSKVTDFDPECIDFSKRCNTETFKEGSWYDHSLPILKFFPKKPTSDSTLRPYMSFVGQYQDYGSLAGGFGVKVMHKLYLKTDDQKCMSWCANRHVPLVKVVGFHHCGKDIGKSIVYDLASKKVYAKLGETIIGEAPYCEPKALQGDGKFFITKFYHGTEYVLYHMCKSFITDPDKLNSIVFIGNFAVPQRTVWERFNECWETIAQNKYFNWKIALFESIYKPAVIAKLPFDFSMKNRQMLQHELDYNNWPDELIQHTVKILGTSDHTKLHRLQQLWIDHNTVALETPSRRRIIVFHGNKPQLDAYVPPSQPPSQSIPYCIWRDGHLDCDSFIDASTTIRSIIEARYPNFCCCECRKDGNPNVFDYMFDCAVRTSPHSVLSIVIESTLTVESNRDKERVTVRLWLGGLTSCQTTPPLLDTPQCSVPDRSMCMQKLFDAATGVAKATSDLVLSAEHTDQPTNQKPHKKLESLIMGSLQQTV